MSRPKLLTNQLPPNRFDPTDRDSKDHDRKSQSHLRILEAASKIMREQGYAGAGLQRIMKAAGMTVGGFYAHFRSKEFLFAKVISDSFRQTRERFALPLENKHGKAWVEGIVSGYLSLAHRNDIAGGCPMPALLSELPRAGSISRKVYEKELLLSLQRFSEKLDEKDSHKAQVIIALLVGGISMARAVQNEKLAGEILESCRKAALTVADLGVKHESAKTLPMGN
jgi:TetR/AcrR family transcriptional regulator, transcriptional repressor for nem operon